VQRLSADCTVVSRGMPPILAIHRGHRLAAHLMFHLGFVRHSSVAGQLGGYISVIALALSGEPFGQPRGFAENAASVGGGFVERR